MKTFNHIGWGAIHHNINGANLTLDQNYSLKVVVNAPVSNMTFENQREFGK